MQGDSKLEGLMRWDPNLGCGGEVCLSWGWVGVALRGGVITGKVKVHVLEQDTDIGESVN